MTDCIKNKKLFLLDIDGTVFRGDKLIDGALDLLSYADKSDCKYIFLTNNSSKDTNEYLEKFKKFGISVSCDDFITSVQATSLYLQKHCADKKIYVMGNTFFKNFLLQDGHCVVDRYSEDIGAIVIGYDTELTYQKLIDACTLLGKDIPYIATNPDVICPVENGYLPDCGSIVEILEKSTGKTPYFVGKPSPLMIELAVKKSNMRKEEMIIIGDRLYTDIACGINSDVSTALVLSGEATADEVEKSAFKPTYVFENLRAIYNAIMCQNGENA